jgi:hypothetical protein
MSGHEMGRTYSTRGENTCNILLGKPEGKRPVGRQRCRWEDNIKVDLGKIGWGGMGWIDLAQEQDTRRAFVNAVLNFQFS